MNKATLIKELAAKTEMTQKDTKVVLEALQEIVFGVMNEEEEVTIMDGVKLAGVHKDARIARNPMDGSEVQVAEKTAPKCKFGKAVKDAINV